MAAIMPLDEVLTKTYRSPCFHCPIPRDGEVVQQRERERNEVREVEDSGRRSKGSRSGSERKRDGGLAGGRVPTEGST